MKLRTSTLLPRRNDVATNTATTLDRPAESQQSPQSPQQQQQLYPMNDVGGLGDFDTPSEDGSESVLGPSVDSDMGDSTVLNNGGSKGSEETLIAKQESKDVFRVKLVVLFVLVASAIAVAASVYLFLTYSKHKQFRQQFKDDVNKVLDAIGNNMDRTLAAYDSFAVMLVATAQMTNQTWPFVTINKFAVRASKVLPLSNSLFIGTYNWVTPEQRDEWEAYTTANDAWVNETLAVQEKWGGYHGPIVYNDVQNPVIHGNFEDVPRHERYVPL